MGGVGLIVLLIVGMLLMTLGSVGVNSFWVCYNDQTAPCYGSYVSSAISVAVGVILIIVAFYFVSTSCS
jgi:hypothetical protein